MKKTFQVINELKKRGLIVDYAVGGGIATIFYTETFLTYDLDIFIVVKFHPEKNIIDLSYLFDYLTSEGYKWKGEHIVIEDIPVQFIVADELEKEAIENARSIKYEGEEIKIFSPEYLIAILLRTGRKKDIEKVEKITEQAEFDEQKLKMILKKFGIKGGRQWRRNRK
ncbi:MAG TPA: nucleotidyltransferase [bacterium]|nr:nucleotidyltransferase [bacterium]